MSSMTVSRVPYADAMVPAEPVTPPGETATAGNGHDAREWRRWFRRKRAEGKGEETGHGPGDKRRPGAHCDLLI